MLLNFNVSMSWSDVSCDMAGNGGNGSLDRVVVSTFPLLAYQEGLFSKEEAGYVTNCLKDDGR